MHWMNTWEKAWETSPIFFCSVTTSAFKARARLDTCLSSRSYPKCLVLLPGPGVRSHATVQSHTLFRHHPFLPSCNNYSPIKANQNFWPTLARNPHRVSTCYPWHGSGYAEQYYADIPAWRWEDYCTSLCKTWVAKSFPRWRGTGSQWMDRPCGRGERILLPELEFSDCRLYEN